MTASQTAKQYGLKSLVELSQISMVPEPTLKRWHRDQPEKFRRLCEMAAAWKQKVEVL